MSPNSIFTRPRATVLISESGLHISESTLENLASAGLGPKYSIVNGRAVYRRSDLEKWVESQLTPSSAG